MKGPVESAVGLLVGMVLILQIPVPLASTKPSSKDNLITSMNNNKTPGTLAATKGSSAPQPGPSRPLDLLFIHHSCGGQLFATPGPEKGQNCIYESHPNGGGLRARLEKSGYLVHEASYGSQLGEKTDIFDWASKFTNQMEAILKCGNQDQPLPTNRRNEIVVFKSCFPNNAFTGEGQAPGNPAGPELTVWNAKAAYARLLTAFEKHPETLFVCMTAPPLAAAERPQPVWKIAVKTILGKNKHVSREETGRLARQFNNWLAGKDGWLKEYPLRNVVVFDLYDVLTGHGQSDCGIYATGGGCDSHPSREGNERAAEEFLPFLNRAVTHFQAGIQGSSAEVRNFATWRSTEA